MDTLTPMDCNKNVYFILQKQKKFNNHYEVMLAYDKLLCSGAVTFNSKGCILYSTDRHQIFRATALDGRKIPVFAHQLAMLYKLKILELPSSHKQVSHRCGHPNCVRIEHLILENISKNRSRDSCHRYKICKCGLQPACVL